MASPTRWTRSSGCASTSTATTAAICCVRWSATFAERLMAAEVDVLCGAGYGEVQPGAGEPAATATGPASFDTRVGSIDLSIPKLRRGQLLPGLAARAAPAGRAGAGGGGGRVLRAGRVALAGSRAWCKTLGIEWLSKSPGVADGHRARREVAAFRNRPLDAGPYTYVWLDALTQKVREGGRIVNVAVVIAVGVNAEGHREVLGLDVITTEDGAGWLAFLRGLVARGLAGTHPGDLRRPRRPGRRHRARRCTGADLAAVPHPLHAQPADQGPQVGPDDGRHPGAHDLRPARRRLGVGPARPGRRAAHRTVPRRRRRMLADAAADVLGLHRLPQGALAADLVATTPRSGSTRNSAAAPTSSASSPTATPSSASSAPCSPNSTTNGPSPAAT